MTRLSLTVTSEGEITAIEVEETDGAITRFTFTKEETDVPIPAEMFHFTPPPGCAGGRRTTAGIEPVINFGALRIPEREWLVTRHGDLAH